LARGDWVICDRFADSTSAGKSIAPLAASTMPPAA
jgi:thymidylate kinase